MTKLSDKSPSFSAFSSAREEAEQHPDDPRLPERSQENSGHGGANARPSEITELERRVLAHERMLQALIGHLANDDPEIVVQLKARFGSGHDLGEYEQDFVSTEHYADHFIRSIELEINRRKRRG